MLGRGADGVGAGVGGLGCGFAGAEGIRVRELAGAGVEEALRVPVLFVLAAAHPERPPATTPALRSWSVCRLDGFVEVASVPVAFALVSWASGFVTQGLSAASSASFRLGSVPEGQVNLLGRLAPSSSVAVSDGFTYERHGCGTGG